MKIKRLIAYIFDNFLLTIMLSILPIANNDFTKEFNSITNNLIEKNIKLNDYLNKYITLKYSSDKETILLLVINLILVIIYFVILPYYTKGQTLGMKLLKIKTNKYKILTLLKRSLIINFTGLMFINLIIINILDKTIYFYVNLILTLLSFLLVITSGFMVLYRHDEKGIHDILAKTLVIEN